MPSAALSDEEFAILTQAPVSMTGWTNVAPGTSGWTVRELHKRGLLERTETPTPEDQWASRYSITPAGREARTQHARQSLRVV